MRRFLKIYLMFISLSTNLLLTQQYGSLKGKVFNKENNAPLPSVNIMIDGSLIGTTTDLTGNFIIQKIREGNFKLVVSLVGYRQKVLSDVVIVVNKETQLEITLEPSLVSLTPVVVTASKREQTFSDVPNTVSVIEPSDLQRRNTITIDDALRQVSGINIIESQVSIRGSSGYSKGVGSRTLILVDGIPMLSGDTGEIVFESLPTQHIDRIEILKGAASALYGSAAMGGVVNVLTKPIPDIPQTNFKVYSGFYGKPYYEAWHWTDKTQFFNGIYLSHSRSFGDLKSLISLNHTQDDGFRKGSRWLRWNFFTKNSYQFTESRSLMLSFNYLDQRRDNFLFWRNIDSALIPPEDQIGDRVLSKRFSLSSHYKDVFSDKFVYNIKSVWYHTNWKDDIEARGNRSQSDYVDAELQFNYQPIGEHILTSGADINFNKVTSNLFGDRSRFGGAVYVQDEYKIADDAKATLGARFDAAKLDSLSYDHQFNPKLGIVYTPSPLTSFRMSVGRSFRSPSVAEAFTSTFASGFHIVPNPNLKSERSWSFEIGASQVLSENIFIDGSVFHNEYQNLIETEFVQSTIGTGHFNNVTRARIQGTEAALKSSWFENKVLFNISYTYIYPTDLTRDDILKYRSRHLLYSSVTAIIVPFECGFDFRYLSRVERVDDEFVRLGIIKDGDKRVPVYVVDVHVGSAFKLSNLPIRMSVQVNNVLQYHYIEFMGNIAPIRNYTLMIETTH
jgi:outer membrane receptor for ferrienterochelin and colicins